MRITTGMRGTPFEINCSRNELPEFFKSLGFKTGAEIGVQSGENMKLYCEEGLKMYGIDPYEGYEEVYQKAKKLLSPYDATLIRKTSMDALADFPKRNLDFVYIDGLHDFMNKSLDLFYWTDKVKKGGIIAGHDYINDAPREGRRHRATGPVVRAFCESKDIYNWYVLGRGFKENMSYFFFKHW